MLVQVNEPPTAPDNAKLMQTEHPRPLYAFGYIHKIHDRLETLRGLAEDENWSYQRTPSDIPNPVLYNYLHYTFERLDEQKKIAQTSDGEFACFNTGLVTPHQEAIYTLYSKNQEKNREQWRFVKCCRKGAYELAKFPTLPDIATYFDDPSDLVLDPRVDIRINVEHIIDHNKARFPEPFSTMDTHALQMIVRGAVDNAKERVRRNYKAAVPQFHRGKVQLLLPLCLSDPGVADLAILLAKHEGVYRAATCLTLDMAYNNARLLARPDRDWLQP
jgi:hypothetical protein